MAEIPLEFHGGESFPLSIERLRGSMSRAGRFEKCLQPDATLCPIATCRAPIVPLENGALYECGKGHGSRLILDILASALKQAQAEREPEEPECRASDEAQPADWLHTDERGKEHINTAILAEHVRELGHVKVGPGGGLFRYDSGVYRANGIEFCRVQTRVLLGDKNRKAHVAEVLHHQGNYYQEIHDDLPTDLLNVRNGLLDWRTGELRPHTHDFVSTCQLPVNWNPDAKSPQADEFIAETLPADACDLFIEAMGLAIYGANPFQKAVMLLGPGGNGKSVALRLIERLCGQENVSAVPLQALSENRFAAAEMYGKLANVCGDLDARSIERTDIFKQVTGGDPISAERKYGHSFTFRCHALQIFSANTPPLTSDQTDAWFSRWITIPFTNQFRGTDREDPHLVEKLTTSAELEGLLVHAVGGLRRLMVRGHFDVPESVRVTAEEYRENLDSVCAFVGARCCVEDGRWATRTDLNTAYKAFCADEGRPPLRAANFYARLRGDYPGRVEEVKHQGSYRFKGITLAAGGDSDAK